MTGRIHLLHIEGAARICGAFYVFDKLLFFFCRFQNGPAPCAVLGKA